MPLQISRNTREAVLATNLKFILDQLYLGQIYDIFESKIVRFV